MGKKKSFEIVLGCYEEFVIGFKYTSKEEQLTQTFASHSHTGSVRSVAQSKNLIASGGADDRIVVYDFNSRTEHRMLMYHDGTVNCLEFTCECTHLISGSEDGVLAIVRVGNWILEKIYEKAHNGSAILDIAIHPSNKMLLSLGADRTLRTWNLVKGRLAYTINLNSKCKDAKNLHSVKWAPDGVRFVLIGGKYTDVWRIDTGGIVVSIEHKSRVTSCVWKGDILIVGYEDGDIGEVTIDGEITTHKCHDSRVKCLLLHGKRLISASSSGEIKVWNKKLEELCSTKAGCRFTSMCIVPVMEIKDDTTEIVEDD